jgi:hypothetical protein
MSDRAAEEVTFAGVASESVIFRIGIPPETGARLEASTVF